MPFSGYCNLLFAPSLTQGQHRGDILEGHGQTLQASQQRDPHGVSAAGWVRDTQVTLAWDQMDTTAKYHISNDGSVVCEGPLGYQMSWTLPVPRTFAPLWEVFRVSSDKLALCHLELTRKLHDLLKDVLRYGEEQLKTHKKVMGCPSRYAGSLRLPGPQMSLCTHL